MTATFLSWYLLDTVADEMARSKILFFLKIKLNDILGHFGAKISFGPS